MSSINEALGLPETVKISFDDAMLVLGKFKKASYGLEKVTPISFAYYNDEFGSFMKPKKHYEILIKKMFDQLDNDTKFELLTYFNEKE